MGRHFQNLVFALLLCPMWALENWSSFRSANPSRFQNEGWQRSLPFNNPFNFQYMANQARRGMLRNPYVSYQSYYRSLNNDPSDFFAATSPDVLEESKDQAILVAEKFLSGSKDRSCMQRDFCNFGIQFPENPEEQVAIEETVRMLESMLSGMGKDKQETFPCVREVVAAFNVGKITANLNLCQSLFTCNEPLEMRQDPTGRTNCKANAKSCPGLAIGCGLCGILAPAKCGAICPMAGIYCGSSALDCAVEKENNVLTVELDDKTAVNKDPNEAPNPELRTETQEARTSNTETEASEEDSEPKGFSTPIMKLKPRFLDFDSYALEKFY